jgi:hypothetical protein
MVFDEDLVGLICSVFADQITRALGKEPKQ